MGGRPPIEELAWAATPAGEISLRRRWEASVGTDVYEVKLGDEFLMSSLFTATEIELARLGLAAIEGDALDVVVGGLGLGYTARAVLDDPRVASVLVVDTNAEVIRWHDEGLLPESGALTQDDRCRLVHGDFFALAETGFDGDAPDREYDAVLLDIDHTPQHLLHPSHAPFYQPAGLARLARRLRPGGVFALWSDGHPDPDFLATLRATFPGATAHLATFPNAHTRGESSATVYVAHRGGG